MLALISSHNLGVGSLDDIPLSAMTSIASKMRDWIEELTLPKEQGSNSVQPSPEQQ
jgi:hypothetical protein